MCIIAVKPASKKMFDDSVIKQMFLQNRDGAGVMWAENETVHFKKGFMTARDVLDFIHSRNWDGCFTLPYWNSWSKQQIELSPIPYLAGKQARRRV